MRTCAAAVGAVSAVVACAIACAIAGVQVGLVVELEEIFGAPGGYSGALEVTGAPSKWHYASEEKWGEMVGITQNQQGGLPRNSLCELVRAHTPPQPQCAHPHPPRT